MKTESEKRRLTILLGVGAVLLVGVLGVNLLGGDDSETGTVQPNAAAARADTKRTEQSAAVAADPISALDVGRVRDPFAPPYSQSVVPPDTGSSTTLPPDTGSATTLPPDNSGANPTEQNPTPANAVAVLAISTENGVKVVRIRVGVTTYTVVEGQTFATSYKVLSLSENCGQFLYGDSPFTLCIGEQVLK